jgi:hypothetical protein
MKGLLNDGRLSKKDRQVGVGMYDHTNFQKCIEMGHVIDSSVCWIAEDLTVDHLT